MHQFRSIFSALGKYLARTNLLDPTFGKNSPQWEADGEKYASLAILIDEVVVMADYAVNQSNDMLVVPVVKSTPADDFDICFDMAKR